MEQTLPVPFEALVAETDAFLSAQDPKEFQWQLLKLLPGSASWRLLKPIYNRRPLPDFPHSPLAFKHFEANLGELNLRARPNYDCLVQVTDVPIPICSEAVRFALYHMLPEVTGEWDLTFLDSDAKQEQNEATGNLSFILPNDLLGIRELDGDQQKERIAALKDIVEHCREAMHRYLLIEQQRIVSAYSECLKRLVDQLPHVETQRANTNSHKGDSRPINIYGDIVNGDKYVLGNEQHIGGDSITSYIGENAQVGQIAVGSGITQTIVNQPSDTVSSPAESDQPASPDDSTPQTTP